ncbi:hypothetical protein M231_03553 [Tremella mesenterica]|uniref:Mitochondrial import receptor subunit tom22 n=1 Tax=Tremella mesenterica TaxID=5217 RepID=A0A4Q1BMY8_TREME|nr:hypothetical protein M231_03553 [Tremella mesenterica]
MVVHVEEIPENAPLPTGEHESDYETTSSVSSLSDLEDDQDIFNETIYDRLIALKDIVPPATRISVYTKYEKSKGIFFKVLNGVGTLGWVISTSALLIGLPLALAIEDEGRIVQQEREMQMQTAGQQQLLGGPQGQSNQQAVLPPGF